MKKLALAAIILSSLEAAGQPYQPAEDSLATRELDEIVVTATRNERQMGAIPMPVSLIPKSQIKTMGSLRLNDVLTEQTGLVVVPQVNAQGNGIQVQGFNPDYTLILLNGEPIIGRYTGSLELSRIAVGNIKQIEIVKGPSSSLYGSDALAGVINIITDRPSANTGSVSARYGTNQTMDLSADAGFTNDKFGVYLFANRYSTDGYDLSPENFGKTVSPFSNETFSARIDYRISPKTDIGISGRYFNEDQKFNFEVLSGAELVRTSGTGSTHDYNFNPVLTHRWSNNFKTIARFYTTHYTTETGLSLESDGSLYYTDDFTQTFTRPEINAEYFINERNILTVGAGLTSESVRTSRYGDETLRKQHTDYGFFQYEWIPVSKWTVIAGGRYDYNSVYGSQFSPKLSSQFEINDRATLKGSMGVGFKSPDFRQLYFNFTNSAAGGYSVLGTEVIAEKLSDLESQGQIAAYLFDPSTLGKLEAERSIAFNFGGTFLLNNVTLNANAFYNTVDNLIETQAVAITTNGQNIFSYRNIQRAFTSGLETNFSYPLGKGLSLSAGYQLLYAMDKDVLKDIRDGNVFYRDTETLVTKRLKASEYYGLYNRSRHTGNIKLFYKSERHGLDASLRFIYRGKYGIGDIRGSIQGEVVPPSDVNNNAVLDVHDNFISGYGLVNLSLGKTFFDNIRLQVGVDNLLNHTEPIFIPNLPGRILYGSLAYSFFKNQSKR